jgi:hypothetical protein
MSAAQLHCDWRRIGRSIENDRVLAPARKLCPLKATSATHLGAPSASGRANPKNICNLMQQLGRA